MTLVTQHSESPSSLDASKTAEPRRCGPAKKGSATCQSSRLRGKSAPSLHGGSITDNSRVPSISTGKRNPCSKTSRYSLAHTQARDAKKDAQRQADTSRHYEGRVAVRLENKEVVLGKYSGGWKIHCDDPEHSGPALLFQFFDHWMSGFIHGEGTFEFTSDSDVFLLGLRERDIYKGSWDHNLPHGQVLFTQRCGSTYEGSFLKGVMTGKGTYRSGRDYLDSDLVCP